MYESADPKLTYFVLNRVDLSLKQDKILTSLYQPIIGPVAVALYYTLMHDYRHVPLKSQGKRLYQLQEILDINLKELFSSLHKLEASGLVKTYHGQMLGVGDYLAFELVDVASSKQFFNTLLLSSLLLEKVGATTFENLAKEFDSKLPGFVAEAKNVSASFFDVFHLSAEKAINPDQKVLEVAQNQVENTADFPTKVKQYDWDFIKDLFKHYGISGNEVDSHASEISQLMQFYSIGEQDFVNLAAQAIVPGQDKLNIKQIQFILNNHASQTTSQKQIAQAFSREVKPQVSLNDSEQELLKQAKGLTPLKFLEKLKAEKGGFTTYNERNVLRRLQMNYHLPDAWLNILIKTCLDYDSVLSDNIAGRIANSWLQHQVTTPESALEFTRKWQKGRNQKSYKQKRVEQGTDWKKKLAQDKSNKNSSGNDDQELSEIMKNLQKFDPKD
ncbi:DnaD domain protein [Lactobacillus psittaci]|uniref:Replication initiation membrane attachment protein n=1 Tax=Lactobacillus psittaci DSM 15354 TaxID=1122152 RepID=A0A0R1S133_9LACO|nr:DnaD domain protein [Lactobacillus psittaci]KRL62377.1 replication initiation membrane attachment protein [Lactobacillus psittaci DSM 15354]